MGFYFNHRVFVITFLVSLASLANLSHGQSTSYVHYLTTCPGVESIVRKVITNHFKANPTIAPGLLRMLFHDCFVHGCDGSILINGSTSEKTAVPNRLLRGYEAIDDAKQQLEEECPGVVSCADILALAARDSVLLTHGFWWPMPLGRRDGLISNANDTANLPGPTDSVDVQIQKFNAKGLSTQDLVTLVGSHTIGTAACQTFSYRLFNYNGTGKPDLSIDPNFLKTLQSQCPLNGNPLFRVELDANSSTVFDNGYFENVRAGQAVLESDQRLWSQASTQTVVNKYLGKFGLGKLVFRTEFGLSMVRMSNIEVKTGSHGEIRKVCSKVNS